VGGWMGVDVGPTARASWVRIAMRPPTPSPTLTILTFGLQQASACHPPGRATPTCQRRTARCSASTSHCSTRTHSGSTLQQPTNARTHARTHAPLVPRVHAHRARRISARPCTHTHTHAHTHTHTHAPCMRAPHPHAHPLAAPPPCPALCATHLPTCLPAALRSTHARTRRSTHTHTHTRTHTNQPLTSPPLCVPARQLGDPRERRHGAGVGAGARHVGPREGEHRRAWQ
jgi:hypothetical protein